MLAEGELRANLDDSDKVRDLQDRLADMKAEVSEECPSHFCPRAFAANPPLLLVSVSILSSFKCQQQQQTFNINTHPPTVHPLTKPKTSPESCFQSG